jgi:hypothetical protein
MRIGLTTTVKNEEHVIQQHIRYHTYIGVTDFIIFLDYSTDGTKDKIKNLCNPYVFENLTYQDLLQYIKHKPHLNLQLIENNFTTHFGIRQTCHSHVTSEICNHEGIQWLIHVDPDELVYIDQGGIRKNGLQRFLSGLDNSVKAVSFTNLEVVPTRIKVDFAFQDYLFKNHVIDGARKGLPKSLVFNPFTNSMTTSGWFWGHSSGKLATRVGFDSYLTSSHQCVTDGKIVSKDYLLHYNIYSYRQFLSKYRNFGNYPQKRSHGRPVRPLRVLLTDIVNSERFSDDYLLDYYKKYVMYSERDIDVIKKMFRNALLEIDAIADFCSE